MMQNLQQTYLWTCQNFIFSIKISFPLYSECLFDHRARLAYSESILLLQVLYKDVVSQFLQQGFQLRSVFTETTMSVHPCFNCDQYYKSRITVSLLQGNIYLVCLTDSCLCTEFSFGIAPDRKQQITTHETNADELPIRTFASLDHSFDLREMRFIKKRVCMILLQKAKCQNKYSFHFHSTFLF